MNAFQWGLLNLGEHKACQVPVNDTFLQFSRENVLGKYTPEELALFAKQLGLNLGNTHGGMWKAHVSSQSVTYLS